MPSLSGNQFKVYSFILSRTLGWQKYAEAIPMSHFLHGLQEADGSNFQLEDGSPASRGTGICKEDTVRAALSALEGLQLITVFPGRRGTMTPANVFMPLSENMLAGFLLNAGMGVLPDHLPSIWLDEHVWCRRVPWRVIGYKDEGLILREVVDQGKDLKSEIVAKPGEVRRLDFSEWRQITKRSPRVGARSATTEREAFDRVT
jgi:hypothetical protein